MEYRKCNVFEFEQRDGPNAMPDIEVISVHVPRCAGTSLLRAMEVIFGIDAVYRDNGDRPADPASPVNTERERFNGIDRTKSDLFLGKKVIHGHFNIRKYATLKAHLRIVFLREPIERIVSHYFFWKTLPRYGHKLHEFFLEEDLDIVEFAQLPSIRNFYTSSYFFGVDMRQFDLIGFYDRLFIDFEKLLDLLNYRNNNTYHIERANINLFNNYSSSKMAIMSDNCLLGKLGQLLKNDTEFYEAMRAGTAGRTNSTCP
jgi:hypothetical protein